MMAENTKTTSKRDKKSKRKSLGDLKATTSTLAALPIEADTSLSNPSTKPSKKRKSNAGAENLVDSSTMIVADHDAEEPSTKKLKKTTESSLPSDVEGDVHFDSGEDDEIHLHGFSTDGEDSSDEEGAMDFEATPLDITQLPTVAKDDATVKRKLDKAKRQPAGDRGVMFIGRLPHGFYEDQLKAYFSQFGTVTRLRVSRNKKTGRSKHYAFLEFDSLTVAQIVADTMDNYLLMGHILRCKLIPKDEVHPELWIGANRKWRPVPRDRLTRVQHNKPRTTDEQARAAKRLIKRQTARKRKLAEVGIEYDIDAVSYKKP